MPPIGCPRESPLRPVPHRAIPASRASCSRLEHCPPTPGIHDHVVAALVGAMGRSGAMREHRRQHSHAPLVPRSASEKTGDGRGHVIASSRKWALGEAGSAAKSLTRPAGHAYNSMCSRRRTVNRVDVTPAHPLGPLAQLAEHRTFNPQVVGSNPTGPTKS